MHHHRFPPSPEGPSPAAGDTFSPAAFVWVPLPPASPPALVLLSLWVYHLAFEQARAVARPSWVERDVLAVWN